MMMSHDNSKVFLVTCFYFLVVYLSKVLLYVQISGNAFLNGHGQI